MHKTAISAETLEETPADDADVVCRYLYASQSKTRVYHRDFLPPSQYPDELSVCRITDIATQENVIWEIEARHGRDITCVARADLKVSDIRAIGLSTPNLNVLIDGKPHPRHGNIKPIPTIPEIRRLVALELADKAKHHPKK